jgi:hypothetical protein
MDNIQKQKNIIFILKNIRPVLEEVKDEAVSRREG